MCALLRGIELCVPGTKCLQIPYASTLAPHGKGGRARRRNSRLPVARGGGWARETRRSLPWGRSGQRTITQVDDARVDHGDSGPYTGPRRPGGLSPSPPPLRKRPTPGTSTREEREEFCCRLVGPFLSNEMSAVERVAAQSRRALSPDRADLVSFSDPGLAPQEQRRAGELVVRVSLVVPKVDARTGPVVLAGRMNCRLVVAPAIFGDRLLGERTGRSAPFVERPPQVVLRRASDQPLGEVVRLNEEEVAPHRGSSLLVDRLVDRLGRDDVEDRQPRYRIRVVERHAQRDPGAAIVSRHREALEPQCAHQLELVPGHRALRIRSV